MTASSRICWYFEKRRKKEIPPDSSVTFLCPRPSPCFYSAANKHTDWRNFGSVGLGEGDSLLEQNADMTTPYAPAMLLALLALGLHEATCFQTGAFSLPVLFSSKIKISLSPCGGLRGSSRAPTMAIHHAAPHNAAQISRRAASLLAISFLPAFASVAHAREDSIVTFKKEIAGGDGSFSAPLSAHFIRQLRRICCNNEPI